MKKNSAFKDRSSKILSILSLGIAIVNYGLPVESYTFILAGIGILAGLKGKNIIGYIGMILNLLLMSTLINYLGSFLL